MTAPAYLEAAWYRRTLAFVMERHAGKTDALGWPYYQHFERVAARLVRLYPKASRAQIEAALLHDALEPGGPGPVDLDGLELDPATAAIIRRITLPTDDRDYLTYAAELAATGDVPAIEVKLADNLDATEYYGSRSDAKAQALAVERYDATRRILQSALIAAACP